LRTLQLSFAYSFAIFKIEAKVMNGKFTAIIKQDGDWWLGWVKEVPGANAQEITKEALIESLKEAAQDILELRCIEAHKQIDDDYEEMRIAI